MTNRHFELGDLVEPLVPLIIAKIIPKDGIVHLRPSRLHLDILPLSKRLRDYVITYPIKSSITNYMEIPFEWEPRARFWIIGKFGDIFKKNCNVVIDDDFKNNGKQYVVENHTGVVKHEFLGFKNYNIDFSDKAPDRPVDPGMLKGYVTGIYTSNFINDLKKPVISYDAINVPLELKPQDDLFLKVCTLEDYLYYFISTNLVRKCE